MEQLKSLIRNIPDFPKEGIQFKDVTTLFSDRWGWKKCLDLLTDEFLYEPIDKVVGIESRGFILGAALADRLNCGFVPVRKKGKLPWKVVSETYDLEYGIDTIEIHEDSIKPGEKILLVDDLIATGGTLRASARLIEKLGGEITAITSIVELTGLNGRAKIGDYKFHTLVTYEF